MKNKVLLLGSCRDSQDQFLRDLIKCQLNWQDSPIGPFVSVPYLIETKYYNANIEFCASKSLTYRNSTKSIEKDQKECTKIIENINIDKNDPPKWIALIDGIIVIHDEESWSITKEWTQKFLEISSPEILILATRNTTELNVEGSDALSNWSKKFGFEIIPLEGVTSEYNEKVGYDRVIEVLEINMWENMNYKKNLRPVFESFDEKLDDDTSSPPRSSPVKPEKISLNNQSSIDHSTRINEIPQRIENIISKLNSFFPIDGCNNEFDYCNSEFDQDNSKSIFEDLRDLRNQTKSLPNDQRREVASKIALTIAKILDNE